jgi:hypothetical protein
LEEHLIFHAKKENAGRDNENMAVSGNVNVNEISEKN